MTIGLAKIINRPVDVVVNEYNANKGQGWGVIAKQLDIKPGSKKFHALKKGGFSLLEKTKRKTKHRKNKKSSKLHDNSARLLVLKALHSRGY